MQGGGGGGGWGEREIWATSSSTAFAWVVEVDAL